MNPLTSGIRPGGSRLPALLLAVWAFAMLGAPALGDCGASDHRPSLPLAWSKDDRSDRSPGPRPIPACSGPSCSRNFPLPIAPAPKVHPRLDLCDRLRIVWRVGPSSLRPIVRQAGLSPIGRVTDVDRPPSSSS